MDFEPKVDLHYHLDATSPRTTQRVLRNHDIKVTEKGFENLDIDSLDQIKQFCQVQRGVSWEDWYKAHSRVRRAAFVKPEVFYDVAAGAVQDAEDENLALRPLRFSSSMAEFCFIAKNGKKPDFNDEEQKKAYLDLLDASIDNLVRGTESEQHKVTTPLIFSLSCQDKYFKIAGDILDVVLNHKSKVIGLDLTNEQTHRLVNDYNAIVDSRRDAFRILTIHVGEKPPIYTGFKDGIKQYGIRERISAALELEPDGIGHAVFASADEGAIRLIAENFGGIPMFAVELCPTSNIYLNREFVEQVLHGDIASYPFYRFSYGYEIPCTVNTDVPGSVEGVTLKSEFKLLEERCGLTNLALKKLENNAREFANHHYKTDLKLLEQNSG